MMEAALTRDFPYQTPWSDGYLAAINAGSYFAGRKACQVPTCPYCGGDIAFLRVWMEGVLDACRDRQHEAV